MVRWRESVLAMKAAGRRRSLVELGAGKVLAGLVKRIDQEIEARRAAARRPTSRRLKTSVEATAARPEPEGMQNDRHVRSRPARRALVTGASGGIGGAIARALHAQGATVALSGTRAEALEALAGGAGRARASSLPVRPGDAAAVEALVEAGGGGDGRARHPGQQCRPDPRQPRRCA